MNDYTIYALKDNEKWRIAIHDSPCPTGGAVRMEPRRDCQPAPVEAENSGPWLGRVCLLPSKTAIRRFCSTAFVRNPEANFFAFNGGGEKCRM